MATASSQVQSRRDAMPRMGFGTLIEVQSDEYTFLTEPTVFDCNTPKAIKTSMLIKKYSDGALQFISERITDIHLERLREGVMASERVYPEHKRLINPDYFEDYEF